MTPIVYQIRVLAEWKVSPQSSRPYPLERQFHDFRFESKYNRLRGSPVGQSVDTGQCQALVDHDFAYQKLIQVV